MKPVLIVIALTLAHAVIASGAPITPPIVTPSVSVRPTPPPPQQVVVPIIVQAPAANTGRTWVPGQYVTQTLPNGTMIMVWVPGHFQ